MSRGSRTYRVLLAALGAVVMSCGLVAMVAAGKARRGAPRARQAGDCSFRRYPATRDPSNPLALPTPPGSNPLNGARFFVDGPRHGSAAGAIASLLGVDPARYSDGYSWARFRRSVDSGGLHRRLAGNRLLARQVSLLEKIGDQPEPQRFSAYSMGGGPGAIYAQVQKVLCHNLTADPGSVPIITTYFAHPAVGNCGTSGEIAAATPTFRRRIDEMAAAMGRHPAVVLLETDGFGSSSCMARIGSLGAYERLIRYEVDKIASLPHTVLYMEAGYSDANSVGYTARALNAIGVRRIRGFYTNDTHENWTISEVRWAERVSRRTHGAHFIVNTAQNGNGPKRNPHPVTQGNADLCNPPGRGLGPRLVTITGFPRADAFMWTHVPGNSSGSCRGGPPAGTFWVARALDLAARANARLGPGFASDPY